MAYSLSFHLLLLALGVILFQNLAVDPPHVEAYATYEISKYCQRHQPTRKERERFTQDFGKIESRRLEAKYGGLIVPDKLDDEDDNSEGDQLKAAKSIEVSSNVPDESAIRLVLSREHNRANQRNWQRCSLFVAAQKPNGLIVTIRRLHLRSGIDWLRLQINNGTFVREFSHVKIDDERDSVAYVANHGVLIELLTGYSAFTPPEEIEIELVLTNFREADLCLIDQEFDCGSFRCIAANYQCDGFNNCGDSRDETGCPIDNLTNYIIISLLLLLAATFIFLCFCYRCCCQNQKQKRYPYSNRAKQYQYVKIRTSSIAAPNRIIKRRASSVVSESDAIGELLPSSNNRHSVVGGIRGRHNSIAGDNLRRFKLTHMGDSMPVLVPSAPAEADYGSTGNTYMHLPPYPTYATIQLGNSGYLIPGHHIYAPSTSRVAYGPYNQPSSSRQPPAAPAPSSGGTEPRSAALPSVPQSSYPVLHPNLFTPPPPPYTPREPSVPSEHQQQPAENPSLQKEEGAPPAN